MDDNRRNCRTNNQRGRGRRGYHGRGGSARRDSSGSTGSLGQEGCPRQPESQSRGQEQGALRGQRSRGGARGGRGRGSRGRQGTKGNPQERKEIYLGFRALQNALEKDPDEIALDFGSSRCEDAFEKLLEQREMKPEMVVLFLKVLAKVCQCRSQQYLAQILSYLKESMFLFKHIKGHLCRMHVIEKQSDDHPVVIESIVIVFKALLQKFPDSSASLPIVDLNVAILKLLEKGVELNEELVENASKLTEIQEESVVKVEKEETRDQDRYRMATDSEGAPPNNFRDVPVVPIHEDIHSNEPVYLRRNKVDGAYENLEHYLDVQFRLLREDFVMPLREGITEFINSKGRTDVVQRFTNIRVYTNVHVLYPECNSQGLVYRLKFDNSKLQRYRWENSKRLIFGSLLCLSKDSFQTFIFATVVNRDLKDLAQGVITVKFVGSAVDAFAIQHEDVYEMVETTAYFEAYRHILTALQQTHKDNLPFQPYLIQCNKNVLAPRYLQREMYQEAAVFDFSPIVRTTTNDEVENESFFKRLLKTRIRTTDATKVPVLDTYSWPSSEAMGLDDSQFESLKIALTKELAIIQGPPGTGKTFMALKIAKLFLHNKDVWLRDVEEEVKEEDKVKKNTKPILVICYTNHALDQFLEGIGKFHPEGIVRIGGRSNSEALKSKNLSSVKEKMRKDRKVPRHIHRSYAEIRTDLEDITRRMTQSTDALKKCRENILTEKTLRQYGLITPKEYDMLKKPFTKDRQIVQGCVIVEWLGLTTTKEKPGPVTVEVDVPTDPVELLDNTQVIFDGKKAIRNKNPAIQLGGQDFSLVAQIMTGIGGTIVSKARPVGGWKENCKSIYVDKDGFVKLAAGGVGFIQSRTKINDGQNHEVAVVYIAEEQRVLLYIDNEIEEDCFFQLMPDNNADILKIGFTCEKFPPNQQYFSGAINLLTYFPTSAYKDLVAGEEGAIVENEVTTIQDQRIVDGDYNEMLGEIAAARTAPEITASRFIDVVDPTKEHVVKDEGGWQVQDPKKMKKRIERVMREELSKIDVMSDEEAVRVKDLWTLNIPNRWRLYRKWTNEIVGYHENTVANIQAEYEGGVEKLQNVRNLHSLEVLRDAKVIGMTTTGAAKYREILQQVKPRITIVEEAAEVLESHIVTALTPACEHLILIGDHKQLRPNPTVYDLAKSYKLDVSLFERLVANELPFACLRAQHRMRPEISRMMKHIYPNLEDHESVENFENVSGVPKNIFFVQHHVDETSIEDIKSHSNEHEAKFIIALCRYLLQQNYKSSQITILTPYVGQLLAFKKHMIPPGSFKGVRVSTVDNFQGEENDIILLSLVRSNSKKKIGFLSTDNRICVALSRAKQGFYCVGNIALFESKNDLWKKIIGEMRKSGNVGEALTLACQNHPQKMIEVRRKEDFTKAPNGGCMLPCEFRLECGHSCEQLCHPKDPRHEDYKCRKPCERFPCENYHKCKSVCYKDCGKCLELVPKQIPSCGHKGMVPCFLDPDEFQCGMSCERYLRCGHLCDKTCGEPCTDQCMVLIRKVWSRCGHNNETKCHIDEKITLCEKPCNAMLLCGHECSGTCGQCKQGRFHIPCKAKCNRVLFCDHTCREPCTKSCPPCSTKCENRCVHSKCKKKCGEPCPPCLEPCTWKCPHASCTMKCGEPCNRKRCNQPCLKKIKKCRHPCIGLCGEPCPKKCRICDKDEVTEIFFGEEDDDDARFVQLSDCGHLFEVTGFDTFMDLEDKKTKQNETSDVKMVKCPKCSVVIRTNLRYGNIIKNVLKDFEMIKNKVAQADDDVLRQAKNTLREIKMIRKNFPAIAEQITKELKKEYVSTNALNLAQNQIKFLQFLMKLEDIIKQLDIDVKKYPDMQIQTMIVRNELDKELRGLSEWIGKSRQRFGEQELEDFNAELLRSLLLFMHKALETQLLNREARLDDNETRGIRRIERVLEKGETLDPEKREQYMKFLHDVSGRYCTDVRYIEISENEKKMIVKAMDLKQGHWFKCPEGHIYCIDQCGGATEESTCPECGSTIGGINHRLRNDNRLAGEMDGARHAAWSQFGNNMENFNLDNLW